MADFGPAYATMRSHEGRYSTDPSDPGGETAYGIARAKWPRWAGWALVDARKADPRFPQVLDTDVALHQAVEDFYRREFWDRIAGDAYPSQAIATEVFECAVNVHPSVAVGILQRALNLANNRGTRWADITRDGWCGERTLAALRACCARPGYERKLLIALNAFQFCYYAELAERNPVFERYVFGGWIERATYVG